VKSDILGTILTTFVNLAKLDVFPVSLIQHTVINALNLLQLTIISHSPEIHVYRFVLMALMGILFHSNVFNAYTFLMKATAYSHAQMKLSLT